jgi:hypothetical protein
MLALLLATVLAGATPSPAPSAIVPAAATPKPVVLTSFSATGKLTVQADATGKTINFEADMAVLRRPNLVRIDLQKLSIASQDPTTQMMLSQMLPRGGVSVLLDQRSNMLTIWSAQTHRYYRSKLILVRSKTARAPKAKATPAPKKSNFDVMNLLARMTQYDVYSQSFALTGHQTVNGHMASMFHLSSRTQKHGDRKVEGVEADLAFADDLSGIPLHLSMDATGNMNANLHADLLTIAAAAPSISLFRIPAGYKAAKSPLEVLHP